MLSVWYAALAAFAVYLRIRTGDDAALLLALICAFNAWLSWWEGRRAN